MTTSQTPASLPKNKEAEKKKKDTFLESSNVLLVKEHPAGNRIPYWFDPDHIRDEKRETFLILGFDTEYKTPAEALPISDIKQGKARYEVLSYQFFAKNDTGEQWSGIVIPEKGERLTLTEFCVYAVAKGIQSGACKSIPKNIFLVAHYNRADIPAFDDRDQFLKRLNNIRKSLVTFDLPIRIKINFAEDQPEEDVFLNIFIRDTILLSPTGAKSLSEIGKLVNCPKIKLSENTAEDLYLKQNMDIVLRDYWELFKKYALIDAEICVRYFDTLAEQYEKLMGTRRLPSALSSIGVKLLIADWDKRDPPLDKFHAVGKEQLTELQWNDTQERFTTVKTSKYYEELSWFIDFITECYHGGRNEQFWFGPSFEDQWSDFDLSGAYPTAMALIDLPQWDQIRASSDPEDFKFCNFAFACVDFKFPPDTRYPTLPVRTINGIIFPLSGRSYCSTPELQLARNLGCEIKIRHGIVIPTDPQCPVFLPYIKDSIEKRTNAPTKLENAFWKEVTNSCYGKTAQGLRNKRAFNLRTKKTQEINESDITNPYYASYITSLVRAVVGEIINAIPKDKMIFSVTTDGFITNASDSEMVTAQTGPLSKLFAKAREALTGKADILTEKHYISQVLGWRTRGQATLKAGDKDGTPNIILAKAGIQPPPGYKEAEEQNDYILQLFFGRQSDSTVNVDTQTTLRDLIFYDADLVGKKSVRKLNMEYDFKRKPVSCVQAVGSVDGLSGKLDYQHLAWSTAPWSDVKQFKDFRGIWDSYFKKDRRCLKRPEDLVAFADYFDARNALPSGKKRTYIAKTGYGDLKRLRRDLCRAFYHEEIGFDNYSHMSAKQFAKALLTSGFGTYGVICESRHIESAARQPFEANATPKTDRTIEVLEAVRKRFPKIDVDQIFSESENSFALIKVLETPCLFTAKLTKPVTDP